MSTRVYQASFDDWTALYVNDKRVYQGHSVPDFVWRDVLEDLGCTVVADAYVLTEDQQDALDCPESEAALHDHLGQLGARAR